MNNQDGSSSTSITRLSLSILSGIANFKPSADPLLATATHNANAVSPFGSVDLASGFLAGVGRGVLGVRVKCTPKECRHTIGQQKNKKIKLTSTQEEIEEWVDTRAISTATSLL